SVCLDPEITLNRQVYNSEMATCDRNRAIAYLLKSKNVIHTNVDTSIELYTKICSINVSAESLANFAMVLANNGVNPLTGERLLKQSTAQTVKAIMFTCGMYDGSGTFAVEVGIPTKSGVGGGLLSVVDGKMGIGVYGPSLDENGNSIAGITALKFLSKELGLHMFA
ncbi:MAG: glutaminase, partial [Firmicutes bacterium]|nr:glutaminase [Bacillota bacterium]